MMDFGRGIRFERILWVMIFLSILGSLATLTGIILGIVWLCGVVFK